VRLGEQLERSRDQAVHDVDVQVRDGQVELRLEADEDVTIACWAAERQRELFEQAFGRELSVSA
jgi:exopolyphosphatase/guanosine-5'-triphosphate,3'-diphosphate pyrophosphatase